MKRCLVRLSLLGLLLLGWMTTARGENLWDLQAVDTNGVGTHPKVGAEIGSDPATSSNRVTITGIALNAPGEILDTATQWQVCVQAEAPDQGGIAAWDGSFSTALGRVTRRTSNRVTASR
jgi:hypothetical protein